MKRIQFNTGHMYSDKGQRIVAVERHLMRPEGYAATGKRGNCSIVAFSVLTGVPYRAAEDAFWRSCVELGYYRHRSRWSGGVSTFKQWPIVSERLGVPLACDLLPVKRKLSTLVRGGRFKPGVTYAVRVSRHVVTYRDGVVLDQNGAKDAAMARVWKQFVTHIWTVA